jgi:hypothetical protein
MYITYPVLLLREVMVVSPTYMKKWLLLERTAKNTWRVAIDARGACNVDLSAKKAPDGTEHCGTYSVLGPTFRQAAAHFGATRPLESWRSRRWSEH